MKKRKGVRPFFVPVMMPARKFLVRLIAPRYTITFMSAPGEIMISRGGQQYGPYTLEQINGYLVSGNLLPADLAWDGQNSAWVSLVALPVVRFSAPPPPVPRQRNVFLLLLMGFVWWLIFLIVPFFLVCFFAGLIAGILHPDNARDAGREAGRVIGGMLGLPLLVLSLGLSIWLTIIGKLPGTRK